MCTVLISLIAGALANITVVRRLGEEIISYSWKFTITPVLCCIPVLLVIVIVVPMLGFHVMAYESVVERMKKNY